jgi:glycyl-tRNA synthetase beta chain
MIPTAAADLGRRVTEILDRASLGHGAVSAWGGARRLAVRVESVVARQDDRDEVVLGPPAAIAFDGAGALGFARRHGLAPERLERITNDKGVYAGAAVRVPGRTLEAVLAETLPAAVAGMSFPKTMRWAEGEHRFVRPVHWVLALHGAQPLALELFGIEAGQHSVGHRFLGPGRVRVPDAGAYEAALEAACVIADPRRRSARLREHLVRAAAEVGGAPVDDPGLLEEVADLVEWPGVVAGTFDASFLDLPRELLVTALRHHQKCFSVQDETGALRPAFLAAMNCERDPAGHIRRGNEWVVGGRLQDARFFWIEDRRTPLRDRLPKLAGVVFHARCGSYADKADRLALLAGALAERIGLDTVDREAAREAAGLAKADLVSGLVGEFPELQGTVGGLLLEAEGAPSAVWRAVYEHYRPAGRADALPSNAIACVVAVADKLDTAARLLAAGERASGSRDPLGLRRAGNGLVRIVLERGFPLSLADLGELGGAEPTLLEFLEERLLAVLRDAGHAPNEIQAALRPRVAPDEFRRRPLADLAARLAALRTVRGREDFRLLVQLTERVDSILTKNAGTFAELARSGTSTWVETEPAARELAALLEGRGAELGRRAQRGEYGEVIGVLAEFIAPVERFFRDVLVLDPRQPAATLDRRALLDRLREVLTRCFDIRELAGQADRRG